MGCYANFKIATSNEQSDQINRQGNSVHFMIILIEKLGDFLSPDKIAWWFVMIYSLDMNIPLALIIVKIIKRLPLALCLNFNNTL